ncbi:MAG: 23S rRNA (adenine(1618)-N(6))-methyltransferase RlmF [Crocinitomix sp.]|nr:23S rRNA (adenine(1618)-N(6))-methyltransferase RlmF [Crocinitomix sp.]
MSEKKTHPKEKSRLHPRNKNKTRYDFKKLQEHCAALKPFVRLNAYDDLSIDFADPDAVKALNQAILKYHYRIDFWEIPEDFLSPPIPGRADYIHYVADLLATTNFGKIPRGEKIKCLDIGVGANCIYPLIGVTEYGWSFIGSDIDQKAITAANQIVSKNSNLKGKVDCRFQQNQKDFFYGILKKDELVDVTICNPPFHASANEAEKGTARKLKNLNQKKGVLNFGGKNNELWYEGGEKRFVGNMIRESKKFAENSFWFTSLVSKQSNLKSFYNILDEVGAFRVETISMGQGNKTSRILAWTFLPKEEQHLWKKERW